MIMAVYSELDAKLLVFMQENTVTVNNFRENISLGTVIVNDRLKTSSIESYCESVDSVVSRILPSGGKIAFISDMTIPNLKLDSSFSCDFFGSFLDLVALKESMDDDLNIRQPEIELSRNLSSSECSATRSLARVRGFIHSTLLNSSPGEVDFGESAIDKLPE